MANTHHPLPCTTLPLVAALPADTFSTQGLRDSGSEHKRLVKHTRVETKLRQTSEPSRCCVGLSHTKDPSDQIE